MNTRGDEKSNCEAKEVNCDAFKEVFKYFKRKCPPPDLSTVVDFSHVNQLLKQRIVKPFRHEISCLEPNFALGKQLTESGLKPLCCWELYSMESHPGLIYIRNPFTSNGLDFWMEQCFDKYWRPPNPTNLKQETFDQSQVIQIIEHKLRWATLGYHHNWDSKEYSEGFKGEIPEELVKLSNIVASCVGFPGFRAEAAIVNYYALDSSLGGHTDHSEKNHSAPLLSFSFGQSAIFLIGGNDKSSIPTAIKIHSGDVVVMSGGSRLCYHAVPKILPSSQWNMEQDSGRIQRWWWPLASKMRLNLNVRQVHD